MNHDNKNRIIGLDIARALAICGVLGIHLVIKWLPFYPKIVVLFVPTGFFGVELFFCLSGFLIGGILLNQAERERFTWRHVPQFWIRRWFRTLPNYYLFLILFAVFTPPEHPKDLLRFPFFLQNVWPGANSSFFPVSWSLCVEEWMYLLLPLVLALFSGFSRIPARAALWTIATLLL